jgi:polyhydroxyalkanoate synthase
MALDIWATENTPFPGEAYRQIIKLGYQKNVLRKTGEWNLGERVARLANVKMPVLNLAAKFDHISPVESCTILTDLVGSRDTTTKSYDASHLGIALGKDIKGVPTTEYWDDLATWLRAHDR